MRWLRFGLLLLGLGQLAHASRRISVADLEQMLAAQHKAHTADGDTAKQLETLELTERLEERSLRSIIAAESRGPQTQQALELLADRSAFLDPPVSDVPQQPPPNSTAQESMLTAAVDFVAVTLQHLPDFFVSRSTRSFDNVSTQFVSSRTLVITPMHQVGAFSGQITYRNGREAVQADEQGKRIEVATGLQTWGEFGPILAIVLGDAIKGGHIVWSHWETGPGGKRMAAFHYSVPERASHYRLNYCCTFNSWVLDPTRDYRGRPAYHGTLDIDPENGAVYRVTVEADTIETDVIDRAAIAVEYGPVQLGGKTYVCPLRSLALSVDRYHPGTSLMGIEPITRMNEVHFVDYHKFGATSQIVPNVSQAEKPGTPESQQAKPALAEAESVTAEPGPDTTALPATAQSVRQAVAPVIPSEPYSPVPTGSKKQTIPPQMPVFRTVTQNVLVDVVVTKKDGDPVLNLTPKDFTLEEDGNPQRIAFFEEHRAGSTAPDSRPGSVPHFPPETYSNVPPIFSGDSVNVVLLDMLNTSRSGQVFVRQNLNLFFRTLQPSTPVAIFVLGQDLRFVQGFTSDASILTRAFNQKGKELFPQKIEATYGHDSAMEAEAELLRLKSVGASPMAIEATRSGLDEMAAARQQKQMAMTLEALDDLAQFLAGVPGRKNLLWFAETFPVRLTPILPSDEGNPATSENPSIAHGPIAQDDVDRIREVSHRMTAARIAVYPIEADGLMEAQEFSANLAGPGSIEQNPSIAQGPAMAAEQNADPIHPFAESARRRADTIMAMEQLAEETGGKAFFNTNGLDVAAAQAIDNGANYYTIGYVPTNKDVDGKFRKIELTVQGKYQLSYRRGYFADSRTERLADGMAEGQADRLHSMLKYGLPNATGVLFGVKILSQTSQASSGRVAGGQNPDLSEPLIRYDLEFFLRAKDITFTEMPNGVHRAQIEAGLAAYEKNGKAMKWNTGTATINLAPDAYEKAQDTGVPVEMRIDLPSRPGITLMTGVCDLSSGATGTLAIPVKSAAP